VQIEVFSSFGQQKRLDTSTCSSLLIPFGGIEGTRTPVQTKPPIDFYMFILFIGLI